MPEDLQAERPPEDVELLLVDDNYALLDVLREHLETWGYHPTTTSSGGEAQRLLSERSFHVVLADLRMSPVSGWEVIQRAKEREGTEVIVMTGYADLDSTLEALHQRVFDFVEKPIDFDRLKRAVRNAVQQSLLTRENRRVVQELANKTQALEREVLEVRGQLEETASRDVATGLLNGRRFREILDREVNRSLRYHHPVALAVLRFDSFAKLIQVNGEEEANEILRHVAGLLKSADRETDYTCRYDENTFAIVFPEATAEQVEAAVERIDNLLESGGDSRTPVFSVGVATCPGDADAGSEMIVKAESALRGMRGNE